jgi:ATP-binding cassette subfamily B protein
MNQRKIDYNASKFAVFAAYIREHMRDFMLDMCLCVASAFIGLLFPMVSRWAMRELLPNSLYQTFFTVMVLMFLAYILSAVCQYFVTVVGHRMGTLVEADMRHDVFMHMQELSFSFFDRHRTGVLLARVTNDLFEIVELSHHGPENILMCSISIIGALLILLTVNVPLALVLMAMMPACIIFSVKQRGKMQAANREVKKKTGEINAAIESGISGVRTSKAFANEAVEGAKFDAANEEFKTSKVAYYRAMGLFNAGIEGTVGIMQIVVITIGGYLIMRGRMNYVDLITFTLYVSTFTSPIRKLTFFMETYSQGMAGFERFLELMRTKPEIEDAPDAVDIPAVRGEIELDHVGFSYSNGIPVLKDISLEIRPGEKFALVGPSGGGKTTICHLIPRFYDVTEGCVKIDGYDVRKVTQASLRRNIGIIQQDVFIFAGTVMDNIRYGNLYASDEDCIKAAKLANADGFIRRLPDGYDTMLTANGTNLSQGQRQLLNIARAAVSNPPVLILDEATSSIDTHTERVIEKGMDKLMQGRTVFVIAHRLSTVRNSNAIMVLEHGQIVERGDHDDLLRQKGRYYKLYTGAAELD